MSNSLHQNLDLSRYPCGVTPVFKGDGTNPAFPYIASDSLRMAVNVAVKLGRPLLVRGEPGTGKTSLARAVASELTEGRLLEWHIKSSERARDGLYTYDTVRRLLDAQLAARDEETAKRVVNPYNYVNFSYLGKAILATQPVVLLIDEIDKADIDFPNDLLRELDELRFEVSEIPLPAGDLADRATAMEKEQASMSEADVLNAARSADTDTIARFRLLYGAQKPRPIVIITSNEEKPLPEAFLRRCLVHTIAFPNLNEPNADKRLQNRNALMQIVAASTTQRFHFADLHGDVVEKVIDVFAQIRELKLIKKPATAELVEWVMALHSDDFGTLDRLSDGKPMPLWWVLFKSEEDCKEAEKALATVLERR